MVIMPSARSDTEQFLSNAPSFLSGGKQLTLSAIQTRAAGFRSA